MPLILPKPLKEWSGDEIRGILKIFRDFDADKDGQIDEKEVEHLAEAMGVDLNVDDGDKYTKDGKIDPMEFFAFYSGGARRQRHLSHLSITHSSSTH